MEEKKNVVLFTFSQWEKENQRVVEKARELNVPYDPSKRNEHHLRYGEELFKQFPDNEPFFIQVAYLLKNLICAQRFEYGNKRTSTAMVIEFVKDNGYAIDASPEEWARICKKIQKRLPGKYLICNDRTICTSRHHLKTTSGGGYAVKLANIPMKPENYWYNHFIIRWVKKHLRKRD
jgi:prophage maintenance system killer protein